MYNNNQGRHPPPHQMYPPPVRKNNNFYGNFQIINFSSLQPNRENSFKTTGTIGSGPQFYAKPPINIPPNQTLEFDDGPKITVFIGKFLLSKNRAGSYKNFLLQATSAIEFLMQ